MAGPCVTNTAHLTFEQGWRAEPHRHSLFELLLVVKGAMSVIVQGKRFAGGPGMVVVYPPGLVHQEQNDAAGPLKLLLIAWQGVVGERDSGTALVSSDPHGRIQSAVDWMHSMKWHNCQDSPRAIDALMECILFELHTSSGVIEPLWYSKLKRYVEDNYANPLTVGDMARVACLSVSHFSRSFTTLAGESPIERLRRIRVDHAAHLLVSTTLSVSEVAYRVGFQDARHFSRVFKALKGCSPRDVRQSGTGGSVDIPSSPERRKQVW